MKTYQYHTILSLLSIVTIGLLYPVFGEGFISGHDNTSHYVYSLRLAEMMSEGNFRMWLPDFSMGMPLFYYYQPIPHVFTAIVFLLFPGVHSLTLMKGIVVLLFALLPWSIYQGFRWMQLPKMVCLLSALLTFSLQSWIGCGFELRAILGWGLYAQLWGMVMTPLAVGYVYKAYFDKRQLFIPVSLLGILLLTHIVSGLIACISVGLLFFLTKWNWTQKIKDALYLSKVYLGAFAISAVLIVPTLLGGDYISGYFKLDEEHHLGIGLVKAVQYFLNGNVLDYGRLPVLTVLMIGGVLICIYHLQNISRQKNPFNTPVVFIALNLIMAFFLLAGAKTFTFLQYTPLYNNLPFLRLLGHLHFFCLPVVGFTLAFIINKIVKQYNVTDDRFLYVKKVFAVCGFLLLAATFAFLGHTQIKNFQQRAITYNDKEDTDFEEAMNYLKSLPEGRVNTIGLRASHKHYVPTIYADKPIGRFYAAGNRANLGQFYLHKFNNQNPNHYRLFSYPYLLAKKDKKLSDFGEPVFENQSYKVYKTDASADYFDVVQSNTVVLTHNQPARHLFDYWMNQEGTLQQKNHIAVGGDRSEDWFADKGFSNFMSLKRKDTRLSASRFVIDNRKNEEQIESVVDMADKGLGHYLNFHADSLPTEGLGKIIDTYTEDGYYKAQLEVHPTESDTPQWALLKVNAHPDWKAKVNGQPVEWVQMSPCFMAVPVTVGTHVVEFEFGVSTLRIGLLFLSFLTITGLGLFEFFQRRRNKLVQQKQKEISYA